MTRTLSRALAAMELFALTGPGAAPVLAPAGPPASTARRAGRVAKQLDDPKTRGSSMTKRARRRALACAWSALVQREMREKRIASRKPMPTSVEQEAGGEERSR